MTLSERISNTRKLHEELFHSKEDSRSCTHEERLCEMNNHIVFLEAEVNRIKNALRPFAEFAITLAQCPQGRLLPDTAPMLGPNADVSGPTIGDCRTAADVVFGGA